MSEVLYLDIYLQDEIEGDIFYDLSSTSAISHVHDMEGH